MKTPTSQNRYPKQRKIKLELERQKGRRKPASTHNLRVPAIHHIHSSTARQQPMKDSKRQLPHLPHHPALPTFSTTFPLLPLRDHPFLYSPKTLLGPLMHSFLPRESVAPEIHLPAGVAVDHSGAAASANRPHELGV